MKRTKRMKRAYLKSFRLRNPQQLAWHKLGGRPGVTHPDDDVPKTKGLSLNNLEWWDEIRIKRLQDFKKKNPAFSTKGTELLPSSCPPRMVTTLRIKELRDDGKIDIYHSVNWTQLDGTWFVDLMFCANVYFWVIRDYELGYIKRSVKYSSRERALAAYPSNVLWKEFHPIEENS